MKPRACDLVGGKSALPTLRGSTGGGIPLPVLPIVPSPGLLLSPLPPSALGFSQIPPLAPFRLNLSLPSLLSHAHSPVSDHHKQMCHLCNTRRRFPTTCGPSRVGANHSPPPISTPSAAFLRVSWPPHCMPMWLSALQAPVPSSASPLPGPRPGPHQYQAWLFQTLV